MFSGIVKGCFYLSQVKKSEGLTHYGIDLSKDLVEGLQIGASVSVAGVCQTVVAIEGQTVYFDAIQETLNKTTLNAIEVGDGVNIERSLRFGDEIGGHLVSGHVADTVVIESMDQGVMTFRCEPKWIKYLLPKGFVALDGASLTLVDVKDEGLFSVHLIPETVKTTTFGKKKVGDRVNLEIDSQTQAIVDTIERRS